MKIRISFAFLMIGMTSVFGQNYLDVIRPFQGMGGRSGAESGITPAARVESNALLGNPALLSYSDKAFFSADLSFNQIKGTSVFNSTIWANSQDTGLSFNSLTYIHPVKVYRGAWVWGLNLQPVASFNSVNSFSDLEPDEGFEYQYSNQETGNLYALSFGSSFLATMNTSVGFSISYLMGENTFTRVYRETDTDDIFTFTTFVDSLYFSPSYSGIGARIGLISELTETLNIGASLEFPSRIAVSESSSRSVSEWFDPGLETPVEDVTEKTISYSVWGPWRAGVGFGFSAEPLEASINYRFHSYRTTALDGDLLDPDSGGLLKNTVEGQISQYVQNVHEFSASLNWNLDPLNLSFATTLMNDPLNFRFDNVIRMDLGFGYQLQSGLGFTFAVRNEQWQSDLNHVLGSGVERSVAVENNYSKFQFGIKYVL